jgi:hypothetical protein
MFMRFLGGGIGHQATKHLEQRTPNRIREEEPDLSDEDSESDITPHNTEDHTQNKDVIMDRDLDEADADEEADYGYADNMESEDDDSEGEETEGGETDASEDGEA